MWMYVAALSVMVALSVSLCTNIMIHGGTTALNIAMAVVAVLTVCAEVVYFARVMFLVNGRPMKWNIMRCAKLAVCYIVTMFVCSLVFTFVSYGVVMVKQPATVAELQPVLTAFSVLYLVVYLLLIPCVYVAMEYMMEPEVKLRKTVFKSYLTGLRHWGFLFIALLIAALCAAVCSALVSIPALIVTAANIISVLGVNFLGDPTGLPSYFNVLQFVVYAISSFICLYINIFVVFVCYFLYGSIKTGEKEKSEFKSRDALALTENVSEVK